MTPAYNLRYVAAAEILTFPLENPDLLRIVPHEGQIIPNLTLHSKGASKGEAFGDKPLSAQDIQTAAKGDGIRLYVFWHVDYRDAFDKARRTRFCAYIETETLYRAFMKQEAAGQIPRQMEFDWIFAHVHNEST